MFSHSKFFNDNGETLLGFTFSEVPKKWMRIADFSECPANTNALIVLDIENLENPKQKDEIEMRSSY